jgi:hypothetical protein
MTLKGSGFQFLNTYWKSVLEQIALIEDVVIVCDNGLKAFTVPFLVKNKVPVVLNVMGQNFLKNLKAGTVFSKGMRVLKYNYKTMELKFHKVCSIV